MSGLIVPFKGFVPKVDGRAFVAPNATLVGEVETGAMVAAGAVVTPLKIVRKGELWAGNPAQKLRDLGEKDFESFRRIAAHYVELARSYRGSQARAAE